VPHAAYVVEPQLIFVDRLKQVLGIAGYEVIGTSSHLDLSGIAAAHAELVFLDLDFLHDDALAAVASIHSLLERTAICVYTQRRGNGLGSTLIEAGARCALSKEATEAEIVGALKAVLVGETYVDRRVDRLRFGSVPTLTSNERSASDA